MKIVVNQQKKTNNVFVNQTVNNSSYLDGSAKKDVNKESKDSLCVHRVLHTKIV